MLSKKELNFYRLLFLIGYILFVGVLLGIVPRFSEVCYATIKQDQENCATHNIVYVLLVYVSRFLNHNNGTITAIATAVVAYFTFTLWKSAETQGALARQNIDIIKRQTQLAETQFIVAHRPRLHIRNIVIKSPLFVAGQMVSGQLYISNTGGTKARIVESHCEFLWNVNGLPMERPYEGKDGVNLHVAQYKITANLAATGWFKSETVYPIAQAPGLPGGPKAYIMGWVDYDDDNDIRRRTAFCREFIQRNGSARFYPVDDPDYEYEE